MAFHRDSKEENSRKRRSATPSVDELVEALTGLYQLLEEYAPPWYTREHHDKALSALQEWTKRRP